MKKFICDECGRIFTKKEQFCPTCIQDNNIELVGYCNICKKITMHEDGFDFSTNKFDRWCIEH